MEGKSSRQRPGRQGRPGVMPFGAIAVEKGFVEESQLREALARQQQIVDEGGKHEVLGIVMLEMGLLSNGQLIEMLKYLEARIGGHMD